MTTIVQWKCIFTYPMYEFYKTIQAVPLQLVVCDDGMNEFLCCPAEDEKSGQQEQQDETYCRENKIQDIQQIRNRRCHQTISECEDT